MAAEAWSTHRCFKRYCLTDGNCAPHGEHFVIHVNAESLCGAPETNTVNYTSVKNEKNFKII